MSPQTVPILRERLEGANSDGERVHALFDLLEHRAATWKDALDALSYESPTANLASYYFHRLLKLPSENGHSIVDPVYWRRLLEHRAINSGDPLRSVP